MHDESAPQLHGVIFDFDGVIANSEPVHHRAFAQVLRAHGVELSHQDYRQNFIGLDDRDTFRQAFQRAGRALTAQELAELVQDKTRIFEGWAGDIELCDGIEALVKECARAVPVAICSGAVRADIDAVLDAAGVRLAPLFTTVVSADDVAHSKPDPSCYRLALTRLQLAPEHCAALEDTPAGVSAARGAGLRVLAVTHTCGAERLAQASRRVDSFAGITLADLRALPAGPVEVGPV